MLTRQFRFLILLVVVGVSLPSAIVIQAHSLSQSVQQWFMGSWRGRITQTNGGTYDGVFSFINDEVGGVFGTSVYVELQCGGDLTLLSVDETTLEFQEAITYGFSRCVSGLRKTIGLISNDTISYTISAGQGYVANATLKRVLTEELTQYTGNWRGRISQASCCTYDGIFSFNEVNIGEVFGTSAYVELNCGGQFRLLSADAVSLEVQEIITYGLSRCASGLRKTITFSSTTALEYKISSGQNISATAMLNKFYPLYLPSIRSVD